MTLPVPITDESVEFAAGNGAELEPGLPYTDDETPPEALDCNGPVVKGPRLLDGAVESGREARDVLMMPPEVDIELVGNGGNVEVD